MSAISRGNDNRATFMASATITTLYAPVYISASGTVATCNTTTNYPIGTVLDKSSGGAGSSIDIALFANTVLATGGASVTAGGRVALAASITTGLLIDFTSGTTGDVVGIAVTGASVAGQIFELIPVLGRTLT